MKKIKYFLNIRKLPFRFLLLLFSVGSGIGLVWVGADKIYYFFDSILEIEIKSNYSFIALLLGILTFLTLWFFRTYDVREQIGQQDFHDALRMLADDKLVSQEIAVLRLIDISKKNKVYNDIIKLAFIKRMKAPYETEEVKEVETEIEKYKKDQFIKAEQNWQIKKKLIKVRRRTYAQYIFRWLGERYRVEDKLDLVNLDLSYQDFRARDNDGKKIKHFRAKKGNYFVLDFVNLTGANLKEVDLTEVDLREVDLTAADLREVDLTAANLTGAKFSTSRVSSSKFNRSKISTSRVSSSKFNRSRFRRSRISRSRFRRSRFNKSRFNKSRFNRSRFNKSKFSRSKFSRSKIRRSKFNRKRFSRSKFSRSKFNRSRFKRSKFNRSRFNRSRFNRSKKTEL